MASALRRNGASPGSTVAFFLGNPTLNPAVLVWILFALGWQWAALRLFMGVLLVFGAAALVTRWMAGAPLEAAAMSPVVAPALPAESWLVRWVRSLLRYAVILLPMFVVLTLLLGAGRALLFPAVDPGWGSHGLVLVGLALAGTLFMIPTGAEIPIIQAMMAHGLGAGPAAALLLTLAPVSVPSLAMIGHVFPMRVALLLGGLTALTGILGGVLAVLLGL